MPSFTISCTPEKWPRAKELFLKGAPNPTLGDGEANLTDEEWIKQKILFLVRKPILDGLRIEKDEQAQPIADESFTIT